MKPAQIRKDIYWVGAIDWSLRNFHGYTTSRGSTYNAFLVMDEKITLIDTVKNNFKEEMIERISRIVDPAKINYVISNHVEPDHSGSIPEVMKYCPNAKIVTSAPQGVKGLKAHYGDYNYMPVKGGDSLNIGKHTFQFVQTPMVHWPDNMVTYCPEEKILFSNDAFGQHFASSGRFDIEEDLSIILEEAQKYYANIVMPYSQQAAGAYEVVKTLDIDMIAPSHGIIWTKNIPDILDKYAQWTSGKVEEKAIVVFDSMWHSTERMANAVVQGFIDKKIPVKFYDLKENHRSDIITEVLTSKYIAVGSPTLNNNMLPTVAAFLVYLKGLTPKDRKAFAFGSYGWGGQSIAQVEEQLKECGYDIILDKIRLQYFPTQQQLDEITEKVAAAL